MLLAGAYGRLSEMCLRFEVEDPNKHDILATYQICESCKRTRRSSMQATAGVLYPRGQKETHPTVQLASLPAANECRQIGDEDPGQRMPFLQNFCQLYIIGSGALSLWPGDGLNGCYNTSSCDESQPCHDRMAEIQHLRGCLGYRV